MNSAKLILQLHKKHDKNITQTKNKINGIRHENGSQSDCLNNKMTKVAESIHKNVLLIGNLLNVIIHLLTPLYPD
jgi:hypothetical protein